MIIRPPNPSDWELFTALASAENWRVPHSELQLFKGPWSKYAHVLDDNGFCGLITSVLYEKSAWIGNLIIPHHLRGRGYGRSLFKAILANLVMHGMTSIWLTASNQGRSLYEAEGFVAVDFIERRVLSPSGKTTSSFVDVDKSCEKLLHSDLVAWKESRNPLLSVLCQTGKTFAVENAVAMLQRGSDVQVVGPWYSNEASIDANQDLLAMMIAAAEPDTDIVIDLFGSSPIRPLCEAFGFKYTGHTSLMVYGETGSINLKSMVSMASLGSVG